jgi:hypothetical protein
MKFNIGSLTPKVGPQAAMQDEVEKSGDLDAGNEAAEQLPHGLSAPHSLHKGGTAAKTGLHMVKKGSVVVPPQHIKKVFGKNIGHKDHGGVESPMPGNVNKIALRGGQTKSFYGEE